MPRKRTVTALSPDPAKRKPGRPKGSVNKSKSANQYITVNYQYKPQTPEQLVKESLGRINRLKNDLNSAIDWLVQSVVIEDSLSKHDQ